MDSNAKSDDETAPQTPPASAPLPQRIDPQPAAGPSEPDASHDRPLVVPPEPTPVGRIDHAVAEHPWYPRVIPFFAYLILLAINGAVSERIPFAYPFIYLLQVGVVCGLLWRYRRLLPELTLSFHWLAIPTGVIVFLAWVWLGMVIDEWSQVQRVGLGAFTEEYARWSLHPNTTPEVSGTPLDFIDDDVRSASVFHQLGFDRGAPLAWTAFIMRLLGMALVVPLFEELFVRSLLLRSFHSPRNTMLGIVQVAQDFPVIGDRLMGTRIAEEADKLPPMFEHEFKRVPLGALSVFGVFASTLVFTLSHVPRDYAGCVFCGIAYCLCLYYTRHKGLGPVCWAHGITNALIWFYTLHTDDWRFL